MFHKIYATSFTHVKNGEITREDVYKILFRIRIPRSDGKSKGSTKSRSGYICHYHDETNGECSRVVLNIQHHLVHFHKLDNCSVKYQELLAKASNAKLSKRPPRINSVHTIGKVDPTDLSSTSFSPEVSLNSSHKDSTVDVQINAEEMVTNHFDIISD